MVLDIISPFKIEMYGHRDMKQWSAGAGIQDLAAPEVINYW